MPPKRPPTTTHMHLHNDRLASFLPISKPKSRARPGWPLQPVTHPYLTPENMASAGFYFSPSSSIEGDDTCTCFLCGVRLGGWSEEDDPWSEHASRGLCAWAETVCVVEVERRRAGRNGEGMSILFVTPEDLPSSETSSQIRKNTYYSKEQKECWWPHAEKENFKPTPENLARAGFVYTPSAEGEDTVRCPYCEYSVEGWEEDDDPLDLHKKKRKDCIFFTAIAQNPTAGTSGKADATSQSSKPRRATRAPAPKRGRVGTAATEEPETPIVTGSQTINDETESQPTILSQSQSQSQPARAKRATKPRATTAKSKGRSKKAGTAAEEDDGAASQADPENIEEVEEKREDVEEVQDLEQGGKKGRRATKAKPRATKARSKKKEQEQPAAEIEARVEQDRPAVTEVEDAESEVEVVAMATSQQRSEPEHSKSASQGKKSSQASPRKKALPPVPPVEPALDAKTAQPRTDRPAAPPTASQSAPTRPPRSQPQPQNQSKDSIPSHSQSQPSRPLSQLDRFDNIPTNHPPPASLAKSAKPTSSSSSHSHPQPSQSHTKSQPARSGSGDDVSRPTKPLASKSQAQAPARSQPSSSSARTGDLAVTNAALAARDTLETVLSSFIPPTQAGSADQHQPTQNGTKSSHTYDSMTESESKLKSTPLDLGMTLEDLVRLEMRLRREEMEREGEREIKRWEEKCAEARRRIDGISAR